MKKYNDNITNGKIFCAFLALIAIIVVSNKVNEFNERGGKKPLTKQSVIYEIENIKVILLS
jgi:hypothetical protein